MLHKLLSPWYEKIVDKFTKTIFEEPCHRNDTPIEAFLVADVGIICSQIEMDAHNPLIQMICRC